MIKRRESMQTGRPSVRCGVVVALVLSCAWSAAAQETPPSEPAALDPAVLRAEVHPVQPIYPPDGPVVLRFTLINTSDQTVTIPLEYFWPLQDGITLPPELILGTAASHPLSVIFESEAPRAVTPPAPPPDAAEQLQALKLAPRGAVGAELNLKDYFQHVRYTGRYRVEWHPLGGRVAATPAEFRVEARKDAILVTDYGKLTFVLDYARAPVNVENFLKLVRDEFYAGKVFHRVIPGFIIQGGCPKGDGSGIRPDGKMVAAELSDQPVEAGTLLMATRPGDPNSASCQFFIALARLPEMDGKYTIIGRASDEESQRTLQLLGALPTDNRDRPRQPLTIRSINLVDREFVRARQLEPRPQPVYTPGNSQAAAKPE